MIIEHIELEIRHGAPKGLADAQHRFWLYQYEESQRNYLLVKHSSESMRTQNRIAKEDWSRDPDNISWGGPPIPHSEASIAQAEERAKKAQRQAQEAKAMLLFFVNHFIDKGVNDDQQS